MVPALDLIYFHQGLLRIPDNMKCHHNLPKQNQSHRHQAVLHKHHPPVIEFKENNILKYMPSVTFAAFHKHIPQAYV